MWVQIVQVSPALLGCLYCVRLGICVGSLGFQDLPEVGSGPLVVCSPPFVRFTALRLVHRLQIWLYFAFLGRFSAVCGRCVGLCGLRALRGLCGFVRVWS